MLVSAFLAGVKRSSGLTPRLDDIENKDIRYYSGKYLDMGESVLDMSVAYFGLSDYFKRR